ncbi:4'-phosphopantetheinyl transferase superfamily protein [Clostridium sp. 19966]|uniref:4'-phosphopantetheinyl transferase family protein n=1 Tax=Clostridium sp. 19966 TaxID=2768166 RepID=UPI0028DD73D5|nr:4'-phosphopantetheinyl transferase superfamily protein [Clostridium sp. 19966]MDT8717659.1 4'-phosphopantetheinyl transferase superfamily protein [Clostridium sp. 19966]
MELYIAPISDIGNKQIQEISKSFGIEKKNIIEKYKKKEDKIRALIGEIMLRCIICDKLQLMNEEVVLKKDEFGKPYLQGYPHFKFNISHSGKYVVCAISKQNVGIDIEEITELDYKNIADSFFTEKERKYIYEKESLLRFYEIWTLKESYIKAVGRGLSIPLNSFSIDIYANKYIKTIKQYVFKVIDINEKYKMALCSYGNDSIYKKVILDQWRLIYNYYKLTSSLEGFDGHL